MTRPIAACISKVNATDKDITVTEADIDHNCDEDKILNIQVVSSKFKIYPSNPYNLFK